MIGQVGSVVLVAQCSCYNGAWSWSEAKATIALQVEKIRRCVELPATPEYPGTPGLRRLWTSDTLELCRSRAYCSTWVECS